MSVGSALLRGARAAGARAAVEAHAAGVAFRAGLIGIERPRTTAARLVALSRYGPIGGALGGAAAQEPGRVGLVDERGELSFGELDRRSNSLASSWAALGVEAGTGVGILCRNHRGIIDATFAAAKLGCRTLYLNTDFAGPQVAEVCARESVELLVHDEEFGETVAGVEARLGRVVAWAESADGAPTLAEQIAAGDPAPAPRPAEAASVVMLTSGTTGTPKGAPRETPRSLAPVGALLSKVPFRAGEATYVAAPMFHALGFASMALAIGLGSTIVTRRRYDPEAMLEGIAARRCSGLVLVPVMLRRALDLPPAVRGLHDTSSLRVVLCGGSQLDGDLARRALAELGPVVYNLYGSTEVAYATIATPEDLRAAPGCAGRPPFGTTVEILDDRGVPVVPGQTGRIFVGNGFEFEGYTGGGGKEVVGGLMSSGDVGHFDAGGRLFIDGRDDEMIVSGGENVFPVEVEELLVAHPQVSEAAVIGVEDQEFGARLCAFVVPEDGAELSADEVKDHVRANLARFKAPREVVFLKRLPRNPTGKVVKRELRALLDERDG